MKATSKAGLNKKQSRAGMIPVDNVGGAAAEVTGYCAPSTSGDAGDECCLDMPAVKSLKPQTMKCANSVDDCEDLDDDELQRVLWQFHASSTSSSNASVANAVPAAKALDDEALEAAPQRLASAEAPTQGAFRTLTCEEVSKFNNHVTTEDYVAAVKMLEEMDRQHERKQLLAGHNPALEGLAGHNAALGSRPASSSQSEIPARPSPQALEGHDCDLQTRSKSAPAPQPKRLEEPETPLWLLERYERAARIFNPELFSITQRSAKRRKDR